MRSDMFPASSFAKWETVMIAEEMEGEGVAKSDAALNNEAQVEPLEKKGKFEVGMAAVLLFVGLRRSACFLHSTSTFLPVLLLSLLAVCTQLLCQVTTVAACKVKTLWL